VDHGAIIGLIGLLAMSVAAWIYRRRFPLASFGWFTFLILLAPTSSFVPILDPMAERRMYLPFVGLLLITVEFLRRWKTSRMVMVAALSLVLIVESGATYQRNQLWGTGIDLWKDSVAKSPNKVRPRFQLAKAYFDIQHFGEAVDEFQKTAQLAPPTYDLLIDWGLSYDGLGKFDEAVDRFRKAAAMEPTAHVYLQIGREYGKAGKYAEALDALAQAVRIDPNFAMTYQYRGMVYSQQGDKVQAAEDFRHVLRIDPNNQPAREALKSLGQ